MMKYLLSVLILIGPTLTLAKNKFIPLDMKPGLWEYKTDLGHSKLLEQSLAKVPKEQRAMIKKMMESKMKSINKPVRQCLTEEQLKDPEAHFKKSSKQNKDMKDCKIDVKESKEKFFHGELNCPKKNYKIAMKVTVINSKSIVSSAKVPYPGEPNKIITSKGTWISKVCPKKKK